MSGRANRPMSLVLHPWAASRTQSLKNIFSILDSKVLKWFSIDGVRWPLNGSPSPWKKINDETGRLTAVPYSANCEEPLPALPIAVKDTI